MKQGKELDEKLLDLVSEEHMAVIRGGYALYDVKNDKGTCTATNDATSCDAVNNKRSECTTINHNNTCTAVNSARKACTSINNNTDCTAINTNGSCTVVEPQKPELKP